MKKSKHSEGEDDTEWPVQNPSDGLDQDCQEYFSRREVFDFVICVKLIIGFTLS